MILVHDLITFTLLCLVLHFIADFNLQIGARLDDLKQKSVWKKMCRTECYNGYKRDYIAALLIHAFVWSVVTFLPLLATDRYHPVKLLIGVIINTPIHAWVDDLKCNRLKINLIQDQLIHLFQVISWCWVLW